VEAHSVTPTLPTPASRPLAAVRRASGRWGLILALLALPVYYGIRDLAHGYQAGVIAGHPVVHHDLSRLGFNFAQGLSNDDMAAKLVLSPATVKTHVSRIMTKLDIRDRAQLVILSYESAMVTPAWLG